MKRDVTCDFVCELCMRDIDSGEAQIRIGADSVVKDSLGNYISLVNNEVVVFAAFHHQCVEETLHDASCDDVEYVKEARFLVHREQNAHNMRVLSRKVTAVSGPRLSS